MNGSGMGRMAVALGHNIIWTVAGSQGDQWNLVSINLNVTSRSQVCEFFFDDNNNDGYSDNDNVVYHRTRTRTRKRTKIRTRNRT